MFTTKASAALIGMAVCAVAIAQAPQPAKPKSAARSTPAPMPAASQPAPPQAVAHPQAPTGPSGVGGILIGMSKESIEAIPESDPVSLTGPLTLVVPSDKQKPEPGVERWKGKVRLPNWSLPLDITISLRDGVTSSIFVIFGESQAHFDGIVRLISERYGPGAVSDNRKEEDCIYRNGNSFKIRPGSIDTTWTTSAPDGGKIRTTASDSNFTVCPSNLRNGIMGIKLKTLTISSALDEPGVKPANIF